MRIITRLFTWIHYGTGIFADLTDTLGAAKPQPNQSSQRFLCVLRVFAVKVLSRINRQDAKSAKKSAKKNSFQAAKDFRVGGTDFFIREDP